MVLRKTEIPASIMPDVKYGRCLLLSLYFVVVVVVVVFVVVVVQSYRSYSIRPLLMPNLLPKAVEPSFSSFDRFFCGQRSRFRVVS